MEEFNLDLMLEAIGLREVIMGVIVVVFLYMLWLLVRMVRLSMGAKAGDVDSLGLGSTNTVAGAAAGNSGKSKQQVSTWAAPASTDSGLKSLVNSIFGSDEPDPKEMLEREKRAALYAEVGSNLRIRGGVVQPVASKDGPPVVGGRTASPPTLSPLADPRVQAMAKEMENMRGEVKELRKNLSSLQSQWQTEINQVQMSQNTAPIYSDAMHLATQGMDAAAIAERCDIPLGEATLVVALAGKKRRA
ncbi:MAG: hypothetical protein RIR18_1992 [Pseudomonadota bacterium]